MAVVDTSGCNQDEIVVVQQKVFDKKMVAVVHLII
jgi:hypothetical protein